MNINEIDPTSTGLQQLLFMIKSRLRPPMFETLNIDLIEAESGRAVLEGVPGSNAGNPLGAIHGGYAATLLDSACACAILSRLNAEQACTTLELKVAFHRPITSEMGLLRAIGTVLTLSRRTGFAEAKLVGEGEKLYASATSTLLVLPRERPA